MARDVRIAILGDSRDFSRAVRNAQDDARKLNGSFDGVGRGAARMAKGIAIGVAGIGIGGAVIAKGFVDAAIESQKVSKQTEAVLTSMGGAAGVTATQVADLSTSLSLQTGIDDELIQSGSNLLLTFGAVQNKVGKGNNIFDRATESALDMSVALGTDMTSASMLVGKALNDPIKGMAALRRSGIQFTDQQQDQIKVMVKSGDVLGAQKVMLAELEKQFGGSAEAQATAADKLKVAWGNVQEQLGAVLLPVLEKLATWLADKLPGAVAVVQPLIERFARWFGQELAPKIAIAADAIGSFISDSLDALSGWWDENGENIKTAAKDIGEKISAAFIWIKGVFDEYLKPAFDSITDWLTDSPGRLKAVAAIIGGALTLAFLSWAGAATAAAVATFLAIAPLVVIAGLIVGATIVTQWLIEKFDLLETASGVFQWIIDHGLISMVTWLGKVLDKLELLIPQLRTLRDIWDFGWNNIVPNLPGGPKEADPARLGEMFPNAGGTGNKPAPQRRIAAGGVVYRAFGGVIYRAKGGPSGTDTVPAWLTPGEFVLQKSAVKSIGIPALMEMNKTGKLIDPAITQKASTVDPLGSTVQPIYRASGGPAGDFVLRKIADNRIGVSTVTADSTGQTGGNSYTITVNALDPKAAGKVVVDAIQSFESSNGKSWRAS